MKFLHTNLTPFFWGPRVTSRRGRQLEMTLCVRAVFRLRPGQPLEAIEDKMEQGFMCGDTWAATDPERAGPITHTTDFAEWKPFGEVFLRGTAHPPKGADVACEVEFGVGEWSKKLRVTGARAWRPGVLFGGASSDPQPFTSMPLTWENAYGGPGFAANPVGKGFATAELPTVEDPRSLVQEQGAGGIVPGTFLPISPLWSPRAEKMRSGSYGGAWQETRAPYVAEEFDWTFHNAAPADQQLPGYLRGDEALLFVNLHPEVRRWESRLPGLRIRALVEDNMGVVRDIALPLDTLLADTDQGRLYLVWRGNVPVTRLDLADVKGVLIGSEPLEEPPHPHEHWLAKLRAFQDDPIGIKAAFPPGFMMVAEAVEAWEKAELSGGPKPDLKAVARRLPPDCPFPPWFLAAIEGDPDPLGVSASLAGNFLKLPEPQSKMVGALMSLDLKKLQSAFQEQPKTPEGTAAALEAMAKGMPEELAKPLLEAASKLRAELARARASLAKDPRAAATLDQALANPPAPTPRSTAAQQLAQAAAALEAQAAKGPPEVTRALEAAKLSSLDEMVAGCLAHLDQVKLPEPPPIPDVEKLVAAQSAELAVQEQALRARGIDHPLLGLFALGRRIMAKLPRPADVAPDLSPLSSGLGRAAEELEAQGVSQTALGPLLRLRQRVDALLAQLPVPRAAPLGKDLGEETVPRADLTRRDLRGTSMARAKLEGARFTRSLLGKADLTEADLTQADLQGVDLQGAVLARATLKGALLSRADLRGADLSGADLSEADLTGANLAGANLEDALLQDAKVSGADLSRANLTGANLADADLSRARLIEARLEQATGEKVLLGKADLSRADLRFAALAMADLRGATLVEADLSLAQLPRCKADEVDLTGVKLDMTQLTGSRLVRARLLRARGSMPSFTACDLTGADLREAALEKADFAQALLDKADLRKASLRGCTLRDVRASQANFNETDLGGSSATGKSAFLKCKFLLLKGWQVVFLESELSGSDFSYADLREAHFQGTRGVDVSFFAARLQEASFRDARFLRCRFVRADLCAADMVGASLIDVQFTGANLYEAKLIEARLATCDFLEANLARARFERAVGAPS